MTNKKLFIILSALNLSILAIVFGGSIGVLFCALTLIHQAKLAGIDVSVAANNNAPLFFNYSKIIFVFAIILLITHLAKYWHLRKQTKVNILLNLTPITLCFTTIMIFSLLLTPQITVLRPLVKSSIKAKNEFKKFHNLSQIDFFIIILTSFISLLQSQKDGLMLNSTKD